MYYTEACMRKHIDSFRYALTGLAIVWREERNFRVQVVFAVLVLLLASLLHLPALARALIVLVVVCVLTAEAFNTALEELCDKFSGSHDPHIAKIKDLSAAAVLIMSFGALVVGVIIFAPYL